MIGICFGIGYQCIPPKTKMLSMKKKVNTRFADANCVARGTIDHRTRVNFDYSARVKFRAVS